ncbi:MAG: tetratricopeptide repeat protein [Gemmataceae bacterium]|nr:tetratricopeptide repeat protein [Gemmataceae bacterium]
MATARFPAVQGLAIALALTSLIGSVSAADDDAALREKVLGLNNLTGNDPVEAQLKLLLADQPGTKKLLGVAVKVAKEKDQPLNYNAAYILARAAQEVKDIDSCEVLYRICADQATKLHSGQKLAQSFGGLIDLFYETKKFDKAVKLCKEFLELKGNETVDRLKPAVMERMIQSMTKQGKVDEALKLAQTLVEAEEEDKGWWALQLKAWVLRESEKFDKAAETYEMVVDRLKNDKTLKKEQKQRYVERNRYVLSGVYVDMKKIDKATEHLKALLELKPDDPTYNNDLGYIWADHDMNLDEAEKLIRKALEKDREKRKADPDYNAADDKDNSAYLDSMGWVLYKQKKYDEAKKYLVDATKDKDEGQHIEIYDHLGDVYKALGDKAEALKTYKKGVELAGTSKREQKKKDEVQKKIKDLQ